jgi:hypothetical protein
MVFRCDVLTFEIEHVDVTTLEKLEKQGVDCQPKASTIRIIQVLYWWSFKRFWLLRKNEQLHVFSLYSELSVVWLRAYIMWNPWQPHFPLPVCVCLFEYVLATMPLVKRKPF